VITAPSAASHGEAPSQTCARIAKPARTASGIETAVPRAKSTVASWPAAGPVQGAPHPVDEVDDSLGRAVVAWSAPSAWGCRGGGRLTGGGAGGHAPGVALPFALVASRRTLDGHRRPRLGNPANPAQVLPQNENSPDARRRGSFWGMGIRRAMIARFPVVIAAILRDSFG
jgi:hypothetical protein